MTEPAPIMPLPPPTETPPAPIVATVAPVEAAAMEVVGGGQASSRVRLRGILRTLVAALVHLILALTGVAIAGRNFALLQEFAGLRTVCLAMVMVAGTSATLSFGGVMLCLDLLLAVTPPPHWSWRVLIDPAKRLLLVAQLVTTAGVLLTLGLLALHRAVPVFKGW